MELLMIRARAVRDLERAAAPLNAIAARPRFSVQSHVESLRTRLSITAAQMHAWTPFAEALSANRRRLDAHAGADEPFGRLEDRLAALDSMRQSAEQLFSILDPSQRSRAIRLLPLCCLPPALLPH
jgi:hypothetical protein